MPVRSTKELIALNADGDRVDDARRRLLADWLKLVGQRLQGDAAEADDDTAPAPHHSCVSRQTNTLPSADSVLPSDTASPVESLSPGESAPPLATAASNDDALPPAVAELGLPPRMSQVLAGLLAGAAEKQIARELALSPHTVHAYVKQLHKRLSVTSRGELLARFVTLNR